MAAGHRLLTSAVAGLRWGAIVGLLDGLAVWWWYQPQDGPRGLVVLLSWSVFLVGALGIALAPFAALAAFVLGRNRAEIGEQEALRDGLLITALAGSTGFVAFLRTVEGFALQVKFIGPTLAIGLVAVVAGVAWQRLRVRIGPRSAQLHGRFAGTVLILAVAGALLGLPEPGAAPPGAAGTRDIPRPEQPDIVLIMIDTLRADHLRAYGYARDTMPGIEEFFAPGVRFAQATSHVPYTTPSTISLLSGRHPLETGIRSNGYPLPPDVPVLAEALTRHGYQTGAIIASAPLSRDASGLQRGFDHYDDELYPLQRAHPLLLHTTPPFVVSRLLGTAYGHRNAAAINRAAFGWLEQLGDQAPFFVFAHYFEPHATYAPPRDDAIAMGADPKGARTSRPIQNAIRNNPETLDQGSLRQLESLYDGAARYTDRHVRALLDRVAALDRQRPTLYILTADHGETLTEVWETGYAADHGQYVNQREIGIPLFVRGPGFEGSQTVETPVGLMDIVPTLQSYLGVTVADDLGGINLMPLMRLEAAAGGPVERPPLIAIAGPDGEETGRDSLAVRMGELKMVTWPSLGETKLFDVGSDPGELVDVSRARPAELLAAQSLLDDLPELMSQGTIDRSTRERLRSLGYIQ